MARLMRGALTPSGFRPLVVWLRRRPRRTGRASTLLLLALIAAVFAAKIFS
jgi:predicted PurR-regulated permease PerM